MEIMKIITILQSFDEEYIMYRMGSEFAAAVTEAVSMLVRQGERIAELETDADMKVKDDVRQALYERLQGHCILQEYGECTNSQAPDCIWCLADALIKQNVIVKGVENAQ